MNKEDVISGIEFAKASTSELLTQDLKDVRRSGSVDQVVNTLIDRFDEIFSILENIVELIPEK